MKSWLRCILIVNFGVRNKIPKIPNAHQIILKLFRKQNIKGYRSEKRSFSLFFVPLRARTLTKSPFVKGGFRGNVNIKHATAYFGSAVEPLRGYRREEREFFSFFVPLGCETTNEVQPCSCCIKSLLKRNPNTSLYSDLCLLSLYLVA